MAIVFLKPGREARVEFGHLWVYAGDIARIDGTVVRECAGRAAHDIRLGHPSGVLPIDAAVRPRDGAPWAERVTVYRTARRLMEGFVRVP